MTEKWANIIVRWLINRKAIAEEDKELYIYAIYSVFLSMYPIFLHL